MSKHTPGPWVAHTGIATNRCVVSGKHGDIGYVFDSEIELTADFKTWPNAHLFAAAPDLLEACKAVADTADGLLPNTPTADVLEAVRAAIRKAEGET